MSQQIQSVEQLIDEFEQDAQLRGLTDKTLVTYRSNIEYFFEFTDVRPGDVDKTVLKDFLAHLRNEKSGQRGNENGVSPNTINAYFSAMSSFFEFLTFEDYAQSNPIPPFRKRYLQKNSSKSAEERQLISVAEMAGLVKSILKTRDKAVVLLLAKTGVRRGELIDIDVDDIDWEQQSITLKPKPKRDNRVVFFDDETARVLKRWMEVRTNESPDTQALFLNQEGDRLQRHGVYSVVTKHAETVGLHDPDADKLDERFTPHCTRHWFTTHLRRSGMEREYIKELRGDTREEAIDTYTHIDRKELKEAYLAHIPTLGI